MAEKKNRIALGSGTVYMAEFTGTVPDIDTLKSSTNKFGATKSGASIEYSQSTYTAESDDGTVSKTVITDENAVLKTGTCAVDSDILQKVISTCSVDSTTSTGVTKVKIGGIGRENGKSYAILFYHKDAKDGDIYVLVVGKNTAGLTLSFKKDGETLLEPEFTAEPQDSDGTLIEVGFVHPTSSN